MKMCQSTVWCALFLLGVNSLYSGEVKKANNSDDLDLGSSWVGGVAPGAADTAVWDSEVGGANTVGIGAGLTLDALKILAPGGLITITGANTLTLDGDAAVDISMLSAQQSLTIATPVVMAGDQVVEIAAGRQLVFDGAVSHGGATFIRSAAGGSGTMVIRNAFNVSSGNTDAFGMYRGTVVLDGAQSALSLPARFFFGRSSAASDATLIVSNGTHSAAGGDSGANANFIGVSGARGDLLMEGGTLSCRYLRLGCNNGQGLATTNNLIINGGTLRAIGTTDGGVATKAFTMGANHENVTANPATQSARVEINGGRFEMPNGTFQMSSYSPSGTGWQGLFLNGGSIAARRFEIATAPNVPKEIWFNGGVLQITNAAAAGEIINGSVNLTVKVQSGGALIDSGALNMTLSQNLLNDPASPGGGLTKSGSGTLTLSGSSTYTGPTVISNGTLKISGTLSATNLVVAAGATFSLADGVLADFTPDQFKAGGVLQAATLEFEVASDGSAHDCIVLPSGGRLYKTGIRLFTLGTTTSFYVNGAYPIFRFTGAPPATGGLFWDNAVIGYKCDFVVDADARTVSAVIQYDAGGSSFFWTAPGSGSWETAANWSVPPVSGSGAAVLFGSSISSEASVSLSSAFTLGSLMFSAPHGYTLQGGGSFVFNNALSGASATVADGSHRIDLPVSAASGLSFNVAAGSTLSMGGLLSGAGAVALSGGGTLTLESDNSFSGGITASSGTLVVKADNALGSAPALFSGGGLRLDGAAPLAIDNNLQFSAQYNSLAVAAPAELSGAITFGVDVDRLYKDGAETLTFKGTIASSVADLRLAIRDGSLVMAAGSSLVINNNQREAIELSALTDSPRSLTVESGAVVQVGGIYTGSGPSNTVHVKGGTLTLTGSGSGGECGLLQAVADQNGTDRLIIDSGILTAADDDYLSVGVRGGSAEVIVNGGLAHFGRFALGVRADNTFASAPLCSATVFINGGVMEVAGFFNWMGDINPARVNAVYLNGGTLRLPATMYSANVINQSYFVLNGGALVLTGMPLSTQGGPSLNNYLRGLTNLEVADGGADIDTAGVNVTITQALVPHGVSSGGLIKRGAGTLTFTNLCTYTGPTVVQQGTLAVGGLSATSGLTMSEGTTLSLANDRYDYLPLTSLTLGDEALIEMEISTVDSSCDRILIPAGAVFGDFELLLFDKGTRKSASSSGTFPLFDYSGTPPDVSGWGLSDLNYGITCTFVVNTAESTIDAVLSYTSAEVAWANSGSGDWSTGANWWPLPPAISHSSVYFVDSIVSSSIVNVDAPVSVREMLFDNSFSYTLSGSAITVDNPFSEAFIDVVSGTHAIGSALTLAGATAVEFEAGAGLAVSGNITGAGPLAIQGGGLLALAGTNWVDAAVSDAATLRVSAPGGYAAAALVLDGGILQIELTETLGCGISLGAAGGSLASIDGATLTIDQDVTGPGGLAKTGGGTLVMAAGVLKYSGPTASEGGLLQLSDLPDGDLVLGGGTLDLQGVSGSTTNDLVIDSALRGAVLDMDGAVTISGDVSNRSGSLLKFGTGTLAFTGERNEFGANFAASLDASAAPAANGDGPTQGYGSLNVANGKVVLGAPGQTNTVGKLYVGIETTDQPGAETAGEVEVVEGMTICSDISLIGRRNGSTVTAPAGLTSKLKVSGGEIWLRGLYLGTAPTVGGFTGTPLLEVSGGTCTVNREFYVNLASNGVSTVLVNSGTLIHNAADSISLRLGQGKGTGILRVTGGLADLQGVILGFGGAGSTGLVEVTGGVLEFSALYDNYGGFGALRVDGGTLRPRGGSISGLDVFEVGAEPLIFDTSLVSEFAFTQPLTGAVPADGGLIVTGGRTLRLDAGQQYSGPTVVSNGTLKTLSGIPTAGDLSVLPGGVLDVDPKTDRILRVADLTLGASGDPGSGRIILGFDGNGASNDLVIASGDLTLHNAAFTLVINGTQENMYPDGTYRLIYYSGADPALGGVTVTNPRYGKDYTFSASGGVLSVTVGNSLSGAHIWSAAGGGSWDTAANWQVAPGSGGSDTEVRFDNSIAAASVVTLSQPLTLGGIYLNNLNKYTLSGVTPITWDSSSGQAVVAVEKGAHAISAPLVLNDTLLVKTISGTEVELSGVVSGNAALQKNYSGTLTLSAPNSYTGTTEVLNGMLKLAGGGTLGDGDLLLSVPESILSVAAGSSISLDNDVQLQSNRGYFNVNGNLELSGPLNWNVPGTLYKDGTGVLTLSGSASAPGVANFIQSSAGTLRFASGSDYHLNYTERDAFNQIVNNNLYRRIVFEAGSYVKAGGMYIKWGAENRVEVDGVLELVDDYDAVCLRTETANQDSLDFFTVTDNGVLTTRNDSFFNVGVRGSAFFVVDGGVAHVGRLALGYRVGEGYNGLSGHAVVRNGALLNVQGELNWMGDSFSRRCNSLTVQSGGVVALPATRSIRTSGWTSFGLNGGTLAASGVNSYGGTLNDYLASLDVLHIGSEGGTIDTDAAITITQRVASEGSTNAVLTKAGAGTLTLAAPLEWAGTVKVSEGVLSAEVTSDLAVADPTNLFARYNFECGPGQDTSGNARHGLLFGSEVYSATNGPQSDTALLFNGNTALRVPFDAELVGVNRYTVAGWIRMNAYPTDFKEQTFFTTRLNSASNGPREAMLRVVSGQLRFMATGLEVGTTTWSGALSTAGTIPLGEWVHFAVVVDVNNIKFYFNGQFSSAATVASKNFYLTPDRTGSYAFGMALGCYSLSETSVMFKGWLDDMRVYTRALVPSEIAAMVGSSARYPDLHIASGAVFSAQGSSTVEVLSGEGFVAGELTVKGVVAPGESAASAAGAAISVQTLNIASNALFECTWSASYSDTIVTDALHIEGAGVVDLGRDQNNPVPSGSHRTVLMYYDTISNAAALDQWTIANAGVNGIEYRIFAEDGEVVLTMKNLRGTLLILR